MYIKHFPVSSSYEGKKLYIEFEGAMGTVSAGKTLSNMAADIAAAIIFFAFNLYPSCFLLM